MDPYKQKVIITVPFLSGGGAERVAANLSLLLSKYYDVYVVVTEDKTTYKYGGKLINLNIPTSFKKNLLGYFLYEVLYTFKLFLLKQKLKKSITISFMETSNIPNILSGGKTITSIHEFKPASKNSIRKSLTEFLIRLLYNHASMNVAVSKSVEKSLNDIYNINKNKTTTIYNFIILKDINKLKEKPLEDQDKEIFKNPVIITAGRLTYQKAHWHLIRSFSKVKKKIKDAKLVILGTGELKEELYKLTKSLNIDKDVFFLGFKENPYKYFNNADVFVLSSYYEGFAMVIVEAMSCDLPIISVDCPSGPKEIIAPDLWDKKLTETTYGLYGILVPPFKKEGINTLSLSKQEKKLADAIIKLLKNPYLKEKYAKQSKLRSKYFDTQNIIKQWLNLIDNIK